MRVAVRNLPKMPLSSSWFTDFQPRNTRNTRTGSREKALFVFVYLACFAVNHFRSGVGPGAGVLNKETRNAGEKPVHGFMGSLLKSKNPNCRF